MKILSWINLVVCLILSSQHNIISQIPQKKVTNLTSDWRDATALAALIEALCPDLLKTPSGQQRNTLELARACVEGAGLWTH